MHDWILNRTRGRDVALETTILAHGLPADRAPQIHRDLAQAVVGQGAEPCLIGVLRGRATAGMTEADLKDMLAADPVLKANRSNLGVMLRTGATAATTVSTTVEIAAAVGVCLMATGGIGGVHLGYADRLDISADLLAIASHPVAVVSSGCKNILDLAATREALETLGVPVVGYRTDSFPAFYQRQTDIPIDHAFDDPNELAAYIDAELRRTGRGIVVCNPIPAESEIPLETWQAWLAEAKTSPAAAGRDATPQLLARVHHLSEGRTVDANIALALSNAALAGTLAAGLAPSR
ncbi:MAG: pseudouridine-5'-phosphate glycosidase [Planctomycetota bacterium]